ncbi:complex I NDUFA9 subunit family protein [Acidisoma cellulosilytica]|uniref:Complex I NDUFA9 subunit family protein n=1 Tax=Acidisoma cellulosilyticum TaxID=2802395 RepID=A0A963Z5W2_9PROT|nr:complex I NDUFA9 subunit family protein [Acidisoma cellulosilyticum]MCB8883402.1 complex I NDUFA9 subunit family protein [Acidisoma cellulosilyticum]
MRSDERRIATVFGGAGFIGRYLVPHLLRQGFTVRVAGRDTEKATRLKPMGNPGFVVPIYAPLSDAAAVARAIQGAEVVVNLVGILAEKTSGDFNRAHGTGPRVIADQASRAGVKRMVHISAIGASGTSKSGYGRSKAAGEVAVAAGFPDAVILRPSIVFGPEDQFFNRFAGLALMSPVMPVISGRTRFQPVYVGDIAEAIMAGLALPPEAPRLYELGGPEVLSFQQILAYILKQTGLHRPLVSIPAGLARLQARVLERLPGKLLTTDQLEMLAQDNVTSGLVPGFDSLGITPRPIDLVVPAYLARYGRPRPNS